MRYPTVVGRPQPAACCTLASPATHRIYFLPPAYLENGPPSHGDRGADKTSWSLKPTVSGDRGNKTSELFGNGQPVIFVLSTTGLFFKVIRGINSESDHSGNSSTGGLYIVESLFMSTDFSIFAGSFAGRSSNSVCVLCAGRLDQGSAEDPHPKRTL